MDRESVETFVYQFLVEKGYSLAAMAMKEQSNIPQKLNAVHEDLASGMLLKYMDELQHFRKRENDHSSTFRKKAKFNLSDFTEPVQNNDHPSYPVVEYASINDRHKKNILCCRLSDAGVLISGGADRNLVFGNIDGLPEVAIPSSSTVITETYKAPVLCVDMHPHLPLYLIGLMDGATHIVDHKGTIVFEGPKHSKYVVRVGWSPCGNYFCSASYDKSLQVWKRVETEENGAMVTFAHAKTFRYDGSVECFVFTHPFVSKDGDEKDTDSENRESEKRICEDGVSTEEIWELIVGVRGDCCLRCYRINDPDYIECVINMNELGDDFVSFSARDLSVSHNGKYLLVATDKDRVLLISRAARCLVKVFYGASNDEYSNPRCCWDSTGNYVFATSQTNEVIVWEARTQRMVTKLEGHTAAIRDMHFSNKNNVLVTASFDKTIKVWGPDVEM
eukprot:m.136296 g.136296  ORF g.136296 m.136296 type:complete len:447 (-) comp10588_c0_seq1:852-2192(-)